MRSESAKRVAAPTCVFVDALPFHLRRNHTDLKVLRELTSISEYEPVWRFSLPRGAWHSIRENGRYLLAVAQYRLPTLRWIRRGNPYEGRLDNLALRASGASLVYSHSGFPTNAAGWPIFWRNSVLDPNMQKARGVTDLELAQETEWKRPLFQRATLVHVSSESEVQRLRRTYPESASKFVGIPYFLTHLRAGAARDVVEAKQREGRLRMLFVGRHGRRKGLDILLEGIRRGGLANSKHFEITIVSDLSDGPIEMPSWTNLRHLRSTDGSETTRLMDEANVFAMPSRFESYGIAIVEAMARGAIPIVPNWEVQREIVGDGTAGVVVKLDPESIAAALVGLMSNETERQRLSQEALTRFKACFAADVVARKFVEAFRRCLRVSL